VQKNLISYEIYIFFKLIKYLGNFRLFPPFINILFHPCLHRNYRAQQREGEEEFKLAIAPKSLNKHRFQD